MNLSKLNRMLGRDADLLEPLLDNAYFFICYNERSKMTSAFIIPHADTFEDAALAADQIIADAEFGDKVRNQRHVPYKEGRDFGEALSALNGFLLSDVPDTRNEVIVWAARVMETLKEVGVLTFDISH